MSLLHGLLGNCTEMPLDQAQQEFGPFMLEGEQIQHGYVLIRDMLVFTNYRILYLDKQGISGKKQALETIPYKAINTISKVSAGMMDLNAELHINVKGHATPLTFAFSKGVDINMVYNFLAYYIIASK